jgi:hypothetical protein
MSSVLGRKNEKKDVRDYGAGIFAPAAQNTAAFSAMAVTGHVVVPAGEFRLNSITIDVPLFFAPGGSINSQSGQTVTITALVDAPRQWIFKGEGSYSLGHDGDSGENTRELHISWFGAFPTPDAAAEDVAPKINKAFSSVGNGRESIVKFDIGNYPVATPITVTRGGHVEGAGTRRTVFKVQSSGFDVFTTEHVACKFSDIQFELAAGVTRETDYFIVVNHGEAEIYDTNLGWAGRSILVAGNNCRIENLMATYGTAQPAGSSLVKVEADGCTIDGILAGTSAFGPDAIVHVGKAGTISNFEIDNINHIIPSAAVFLDATAGSVARGTIGKIKYGGFSGSAPDYIVKFVTGSAFGISDVCLDGATIGAYATNGILFQQDSTGAIERVSLDNVKIAGGSGIGIDFVRTSGQIVDIAISETVNTLQRETPFSYSGGSIDVKMSPFARNANTAFCYDLGNLGDNSAVSIDLGRPVFAGMLTVNAGSAEYGIYSIRAAVSPTVSVPVQSASMRADTVALSGDTGVDGTFTTSVTDGILYFENRTGAAKRVSVSLLTGIF